MNKRFNDRLLSLLLAWWLIAALAIPLIEAAAPDENTVTISTVADLQAFSKNCSLDTWSQGKVVVLTADLDLDGKEFTPIPTFGGTFEGQGHIISGLRLTGPGSNMGLFRYVQPGAAVRNLTVKGTVAPGGTASTVGGIAGDNAGTLEGCAFRGTVEGKSAVGGVAGRNSASGQLVGCSASGSVSGESAAGGIAGRNLGLILSCENTAGVNLTQTETDLDLKDVDAAALEERASADDETYHLLNGCSDTGGIAGWSSGVIQSCTNRGDVGYPHVGYNTGGIAGRQSGYLAGCVNSGAIHGRKDVGGIVGQAEPWLIADPGRDTLGLLRAELDTLDALINRALDDAQRTGDDVTARLETMGRFTDSARDSSRQMLDRISDFTDENIGTVNTLAADVTNALDKISPALDDLADVGGQVERLSRQLANALDDLDGAADVGSQAAADARAALEDLRAAQRELDAASGQLKQALDTLYRLVFPGGAGSAPVPPSSEELEQAREDLDRAFAALRRAGDGLNGALSDFQRALGRSDALAKKLRDALGGLQDAAGSSTDIGRLLRRALNTIGGAVDSLTGDGPSEFTPLGEDFRAASDSLYDALGGLSGEMEGLNGTLQGANDTLTSDLRAISRQFNVVFNLLLDELTDAQTAVDEGVDGLIQDTSEEDIAATREGKVADCRNTGAVEGDRNIGGVIGAVAIELDLDPEDDSSDLFSFGSTYETKAVLLNCLNYGAVTAKKDCVGGLAGRMDLGTALDCQNYGPVSSTGGDYVGGVAGYADASVRGCYAKSPLSGKNYVGGVAGWASRLQGCYAIATITGGEECLGAIAGGVKTDGVLRDNRFVDTGAAGVDGVSYAGRAEPIPFDQLSQLPDIPPEFTAFTLTLMAGDEITAQIPFLYGEDLSRIALPPVPEQEDCYGFWPEFDTSGLNSDLTVEAVYAPWVTVAASQELSGRLSLALAEGQFTGDAVLHVTESRQAPPPEANEEAVVWEITLTGTELEEQDPVPLRLLSPGGRAKVWQLRDGRWQQTETALNGQYLILSMIGPQGTFCIQPQADMPWILFAAVGAALVILLLVILGKKRKKLKAAKAAKMQEEQQAATKS